MACPILLAAFTGSAASALFDPVRGSVTLAVAFGSAAAAYLIARVVDFETSEGSQFAKALLMTPLPLALVVCLIWLRLSYLRTELAFIAPAYWALLTLLLVVAATRLPLEPEFATIRAAGPKCLERGSRDRVRVAGLCATTGNA